MNRTTSKLAVITGASGGIGRALAQRLATDGWNLHLCDVDKDRLESMQRDLPNGITTISESFLDTPQACELVLRETPDSVDALVHLAGTFEFHGSEPEAREIYDRTIRNNQTNTYDMSAAIESRMANHGRMVGRQR